MGTPYIGEIRMVGFSYAPPGWFPCNGLLLAIADYSPLFNLIGTTYGGDGINTFGLPNLQSRVAIHQGSDNAGNSYALGATGGLETVQLNASTLGSHGHPFAASSNTGNATSPTGNYPANTSLKLYVSDPNNNVVAFANNAITPTGAGGAHNNIMPYQCINFIIAVEGIYPTQN